MLSQFLDIDIFEQQYLIGHEDIRETAALIREYKRKDFSTDLASANDIISQHTGSYEQMKLDKSEHEEMKTNLNDIIFTMTKELKKVDDTLKEPDDIKYEITQLNDSLGNTKLEKDHQIELIKSQEKLNNELNQKIKKVNVDILETQLSELTKYNANIIRFKNA